MIIYFQDDKKLVTKLLKSCLKLIEFANKHMVQLTKTGDIAAIVQNKLLKLIIEEVNFKDQVSDNKYFTDQQLIFLELHLKIEELGKKAEETQ